jgi:hypothetical protein
MMLISMPNFRATSVQAPAWAGLWIPFARGRFCCVKRFRNETHHTARTFAAREPNYNSDHFFAFGRSHHGF